MSVDEMIKAEKREYFRQWRANNKDKVKANNDRYWKKRAEKKLAEKKNNNL